MLYMLIVRLRNIESRRLGKTIKIIKSNHPLTTASPPLSLILKSHVHKSLKCLQELWLHQVFLHPVLMPNYPYHEEILLDIQSKPPLVQLEAIASCLITWSLRKETYPSCCSLLSGHCGEWWGPSLALFFSRFNSPSFLSYSPRALYSSSLTSFAALLYNHLSNSITFF